MTSVSEWAWPDLVQSETDFRKSYLVTKNQQYFVETFPIKLIILVKRGFPIIVLESSNWMQTVLTLVCMSSTQCLLFQQQKIKRLKETYRGVCEQRTMHTML